MGSISAMAQAHVISGLDMSPKVSFLGEPRPASDPDNLLDEALVSKDTTHHL